MSNERIVPFGKYKGQPVEAMAQDRAYCEWLQGQNWFRERYATLNTLIINNFSEATETPDHNALQVLFLEDTFCQRFATVLNPKWRAECLQALANDAHGIIATLHKELEKSRQTVDEYDGATDWRMSRRNDAIKEIAQIEALMGKFKSFAWKLSFWRQFENGGVDVEITGAIRAEIMGVAVNRWPASWSLSIHADKDRSHELYARVVSARIELKPEVGDDYPAVLRQMRANKSEILFLERYTGIGATEDQFVKTFALSGFKVVFRREVDAVASVGASSGSITL